MFSPRGKMLALGHGPEAALCNVRRFFRKHGDIGPEKIRKALAL